MAGGQGAASLAPVRAVLEAGLREGIAPALSAVVLRQGAVVHEGLHGQAGDEPLGPGHLFDVASLTKVLATGTLAARFTEAGALPLDARVSQWLPTFAGAKAAITVRQLLSHASGLPAWRPLHQRLPPDPDKAQAALEGLLAAEPLEAAPGARAQYSDLGFLALGLLLERLGGGPLDRLCEERVLLPLGLQRTFFRAAGGRSASRHGPSAFVPTCVRERGELRRGEVHDDNARALGGVAGHAGLFSTARDVAELGQAWLLALSGRSSFLSAETASAFAAQDETPRSHRALAWDRPSGDAPAIGSRLGTGARGAIGHLGFTGCSLWLDLDAGLSCALLTSHCPAVGHTERIQAFRRRFHDAVAQGLGI